MDGVVTLESVGAMSDLERRFAELVGTHRERARSLAWRLVGGDDAAAEDVTQDAFAKAHQALPRFRGEASLETWFYRILVRQAANHRRWRAVRQRWAGGDVDAPDPRPRPDGDPALRRRIAGALENLSRLQRESFVLVHMEGFTVRECAEIMGRPMGTVKSHLHRALRSLRADLADLDPASDGLGVEQEA
jgi:RNA polymerase sigma-70 factor (ECF subfamily)